MGRRWCRCRQWGVGVCLLALAGCVPAKEWTKDRNDQAPPASEQPAAKSVDGGQLVQANKAAEATRQETPPLPPSPTSTSASEGYQMRGDAPLVTERIAFYQQKKSEWDEAASRVAGLGAGQTLSESWQECRQELESALAGYQRLQAGLERGLNPWEAVERDMHYFAKDCGLVLATAQTQGRGSLELSGAAAPGSDQIRQYFEAGQYPEAVTAYATLSKGQEWSRISREDKVLYSRALVKLGRFQEATAVLTALLKEAGPSTDLAALDVRMLTGDVLLAAGQVDEARQVYEGLAKVLAPLVSQQEWATAHVRAFGEQVNADDLELYRELIQAYLRFDGQRVPQALIDGVAKLQGRSTGPFLDLARMILNKAMAKAQSWLRSQLAEVRGLIDSHDLARARQLLEQVSAAAPEEMKATITQLEAEIVQTETAAMVSPKTAETQQPVSPWEDALHLFEQQKYDEAIAEFQKFLNSEYGSEAQAKIAEATELAAAAMRRQAAALYAKARKTFDPETKRQILLSSRTLLVGLIEKYPTSSIVDKARQNLKVLDVELGQATAASPPGPVPLNSGVPAPP